jgi:hypothetical protein
MHDLTSWACHLVGPPHVPALSSSIIIAGRINFGTATFAPVSKNRLPVGNVYTFC